VFSLFADLGIRFLIQGFGRGHGRRGGVVFAGARRRRERDRTLSAALPWVMAPVIADVLVFVLAIIFIKFPAARSSFRKRGLNRCSTMKLSRRRFLGNFAFASAAIATGTGSWVIRPDWANAAEGTDQARHRPPISPARSVTPAKRMPMWRAWW